MDANTQPGLYCYSLTRSQDGAAPSRFPYWCVARYVAHTDAKGRLTWRRDEDMTPGYRSQRKAIVESGLDERRVTRVRQYDAVSI